jgi:hypothetical protein
MNTTQGHRALTNAKRTLLDLDEAWNLFLTTRSELFTEAIWTAIVQLRFTDSVNEGALIRA